MKQKMKGKTKHGGWAFLFGEFWMSPSDRRLDRQGASVPLPPKAFDAVHLLVRNHGSLVSRREIVDTLWPGIHVAEANLTNVIGQIRKELGREAIETVSKYGYRFTVP
jgi:DNA-binding winged helix-turn-helix (wHTH) protein